MASSKPRSRNIRKGRHSQSGCYYLLTTTVAGRRRIFAADDHATVVLNAIRWLHSKNRFITDAAVVMPDHIHLVGQLGNTTLARVMHALKSYSANCLSRSGVETPIWQDGYHDHGIRDDEDYRALVQYVIENPIRAGLVERLEDYPNTILPDWWDN